MKPDSVLQPAGRHRPWVPYFVLGVALVLTIVATIYVDRSSMTKDTLRFDAAVQQTQEDIDSRLETYIAMLRATGALFATDSSVSAAEFASFVGTLELPARYPGIQAIGFSLRLPPGSPDSLARALNRIASGPLRYRPSGDRDEHHAIIYLEPLTLRNRAAVGFDMFSESVRRRAMQTARDNGRPAASGRVTLVQEVGRNKQAGFLIYLPIYRGGTIPATAEARRRELLGFVYGPFRAGDLLSSIFAQQARPRLHMAVYDGTRIDEAALLYRSGPTDTGSDLSAVTRLNVAGRPWTIVYAPRAAFAMASARSMTPYILVAGLVVSFLFFYVTRSEARARRSAEGIAADLVSSRDALGRSEVRFRTMIEQSPLAIQLFALDGTCVHSNESWETLWGASRNALDDYNVLADTQLEALGIMPEIHKAFAGQSVFVPPFRYDPQAIGKPGRPRWVRLFLYPIRAPDGELTEVTLTAEDVTGQIDAQRELSLAKEAAEAANRAKDRFLAVLSHELRTPLTPVMAAVQMIEEEPVGAIGDMVGVIKRNVELEARLIDDLLDLTRIGNGKLQLDLRPSDIHELVRATVEMSRSTIDTKQIEVVIDLKATRSVVNGDPARIHQVLWNLINNAVKFTPDRGQVVIRTRNVGDRIELDVEDTGIGIEPEVLPRIFDAFEQGEQTITRRYGGLGLGLAISRMLVDMHGGHLAVASDGPGKGASFTVSFDTLPAGDGRDAVAEAPEQAPDTTGGVRILLVDDHYDTNQVMKMLLEQKGYRVTTADSVTSALEIAGRQQFDLLISDIGLPDGSGLELMEHLKTIRPVPGIALSGFGMEDDIRKSLDAGFRRHLIKPVNVKQLQEAVEQLVR